MKAKLLLLIILFIASGCAVMGKHKGLTSTEGLAALGLSPDEQRIVIVDFWAAWCPNCRRILEEIDYRYSKDRDVAVVSVNLDRHPSSAAKLLSGKSFEKIIFDSNGNLAEKFGVSGIPCVIKILPNAQYVGGCSAEVE